MSLWLKLKKWYEPKFIITSNTYPFETEELPSSPLVKFVRRVVKHWFRIISTIGVVFTVIAAIYTVRAFYAIPQTSQSKTIPEKTTTNPKEDVAEKEFIKLNNPQLVHNQSRSPSTKSHQEIEISPKADIGVHRTAKAPIIHELIDGEKWSEKRSALLIELNIDYGYYTDMPNHNYNPRYFVKIKTPESNELKIEVKEGWERTYSYYDKNYILIVNKLNIDSKSMTITVKEI